MATPRTVLPPKEGVWRIGRGAEPLTVRWGEPETLEGTRTGNRFDTGKFGVLYFASSLEACFGETLARFRPSSKLIALIAAEWHEMGFMKVGAVPADWRFRRTAVKVVLPQDRYLDVDSPRTHQYLRSALALGLSSLGYEDLDIATARGKDRRVTRLISEWAYRAAVSEDDPTPLYAGLRYVSRLNNAWECWAVFHDIELEVVDTRPITLDMPELVAVAKLFELQVF